MIKLYFKKLLATICFILVLFAIYLIGFSFSSTITNLVLVFRIAFICIATVCSLAVLYKIRIKDIAVKTTYIATQNNSFFKDIIYVLKSKDYIAEVLAFETLVIPLFVYAAISEHTPFVPFVVGTMALIVISVLAFSLVDITIWIIVYKRWRNTAT